MATSLFASFSAEKEEEKLGQSSERSIYTILQVQDHCLTQVVS